MFLKILFGINIVLAWIISHGGAFADGCKPMWRWPRPAGAPEWDTDFNGRWRMYFTWIATIMDVTIAALLIRHFV